MKAESSQPTRGIADWGLERTPCEYALDASHNVTAKPPPAFPRHARRGVRPDGVACAGALPDAQSLPLSQQNGQANLVARSKWLLGVVTKRLPMRSWTYISNLPNEETRS